MGMRLLLVVIQEPIPGAVLSDLAADVGIEKACEYYKALIGVMVRQLRGLENCRIRFCYTPADAGDAIRFWLLPKMEACAADVADLYHAPFSSVKEEPQEIDFYPLCTANTADGIREAFTDGFAEGFEQIALIDPTCLECGARWINATFSRLHPESSRDVVLGPTESGRYYILALRAETPELFTDIPWDSPQLLKQTQSAAKRAKRETELLPPLTDTINLQDWQRLLECPLGPALKKALGHSIGDMEL